jgi:hypothetical protein
MKTKCSNCRNPKKSASLFETLKYAAHSTQMAGQARGFSRGSIGFSGRQTAGLFMMRYLAGITLFLASSLHSDIALAQTSAPAGNALKELPPAQSSRCRNDL